MDGQPRKANGSGGGETTLATLRPGDSVVITAIDYGDPAVQRLMVLGFVVGAELEFTGSAIGGDPLEFRLYGSGVSLRREQASRFRVARAGG